MIHEGPQPANAQEVFDAIARNDVERLLMIPIELGSTTRTGASCKTSA